MGSKPTGPVLWEELGSSFRYRIFVNNDIIHWVFTINWIIEIFSKIFLMVSVAQEEEDGEDLQILEEQILDTIYLFL